jgi:hypothetical protein
MSDHFSELENAWNSGKKDLQSSSESLEVVYSKIQKNKRENFLFYYGTIIILTMTLVGISSFFYFVAPVQEVLSRVGAGFMIVGLIVRIIIEIVSTLRAKRIQVQHTSVEALNQTIAFYQFRKNIHGVLAPIIVAFYTIGFYMITPEFLMYLSVESVILFDVSYLIIAIILFIQIRKGIVKEMEALRETIQLKKELRSH